MPRIGRCAGGSLSASLALAVVLALSAPLVHLHLAAAHQGLCGEHQPQSAPARGSDVCSLCLAGAHAPAMGEPGAPLWARPATTAAVPTPAPALHVPIASGRPGTPRAPPLPA